MRQWFSVANNKKALRRSPRGAEIERRARFDYDDLLELFSFQGRGGRGPVTAEHHDLCWPDPPIL
jgi:hypothetical protein